VTAICEEKPILVPARSSPNERFWNNEARVNDPLCTIKEINSQIVNSSWIKINRLRVFVSLSLSVILLNKKGYDIIGKVVKIPQKRLFIEE